jgi:hypothetical protein
MTAAAIAAAYEVPWEADDEGDNMVKMLALLAAWRPCNSCGALVLYVDDNARTDTQFVCGHCEERAERELASAARMACAGGLDAKKAN